jgi:sarcosine oxidase subunit beta
MKRTAEVVIIGGGCMGASTAYHLARRGVTDVVMVEREPMLGTGSTGRNAGGVRHQFSSEANVRLSIESIRMIERFHEEVGYEVDFHQDGYLFLISTEEDLEAFRRAVEMQRRLGVAVDVITPEEARRLSPGLEVEGVIAATFCARDGIADPNGVTMGFAKAAQRAGVEINRDTEVTAILTEGGRVKQVTTNRGSISTPNLVNAAGPYARRVGEMAGLDIPVLPYRRHIFITEPVTAAAGPVPDSRIMVIDYESTFYFHREGAGVLFGMGDRAEPPGFDMTVKWDFLEEVTRVAIGRLPVLGSLGIAHAWAGLYEVTPDAMPIIGSARGLEGFYLINGFSGHGFQHSPAAGRILADVIVDGGPAGLDISPFALERFAGARREAEATMI